MINKIRLFPGTHQQVHTLPFVVDRTNVFTGRVELHVEEDWNTPSATYMSLGYGANVASISGLTGMASGGNKGPTCIGVERRFDEANNMGIYTYTFEGIATIHSTDWCEFELEFTMSQEPIETHPNFKNINAVYGPYDAINRIWPQYITAQSQETGLGAKSTDVGAVLNPMRGISSFYLPGLMYRITYSDTDTDPDLMNGIGALVPPPGPPKLNKAFPSLGNWLGHFAGKRDWLKMAPKLRQRGSCVSVTEEYMLSGYVGWMEAVYSEDALLGRSL